MNIDELKKKNEAFLAGLHALREKIERQPMKPGQKILALEKIKEIDISARGFAASIENTRQNLNALKDMKKT